MIRRPPRSTRMTHSFPTRRSSDLTPPPWFEANLANIAKSVALLYALENPDVFLAYKKEAWYQGQLIGRSEEHTSELQSLMRISYAVFCLKKKNNNTQEPENTQQ